MVFIKHIKKPPINQELCELYGALLGDGCISVYRSKDWIRYDVVIVGHKFNDNQYHEYLCKLFEKVFEVHTRHYTRDSDTTSQIFIRSKELCLFLKERKFPVGKKPKDFVLPSYFLSLDWHFLKYFVRGLFDTDGCIFAKKNEKYKYPYICITNKSTDFLNQLRTILRKQGYPVYVACDDLFMKGIKNVDRWMQDVGSSNEYHKKKYAYFQRHKQLPAHLLIR